MSGLEFVLFGPFEARVDGRPLDSFRTNKVQALLIYLLVESAGGLVERVGRASLMALFWPEMPRKSAQVNLRNALYHLRKAIPQAPGGPGDPVKFVLSDRQEIFLNPEARYELDVASFIRLAGSDEPQSLSAAAALYRGDFLADFYLEDSAGFESWAARWRARLRRQLLEALDRLASHYLEAGQVRQAGKYARQALAVDNLRESAHRQLMVALAQMGRRAEAIRQYDRCRALLEKELGVAPAAETEAVLAAVQQNDQAGRRRWRLPVPVTPLIGRETELDDTVALLKGNARLVSIVGPGGIGKTRLALDVAHRLAGGSDGAGRPAAFVDLAPVEEAADLVPAVARAVALGADKGNREGLKRRLLDYLKGKEMLLVLDNFEHLIGATPLVKELLRSAPEMKLLVTSRERLRLKAEHVYPLAGLGYSDYRTPVEAIRDPAVQLFCKYARRARPSFTLRSKHLAPLQQILEITAGMPLALLLAAGWVDVLDPAEIAVEIERSLGFLEATHRDIPHRQRSMRAVFGATWQRLSSTEREEFAALSVFHGGFSRAAAESVAGTSLADLRRLADHSLLVRHDSGRFEIHELLRQFAAEKLAEMGQTETMREAHSRHYLTALADCLPLLKGSDQLAAVENIETDFENIRAAWHWPVQHGPWAVVAGASESLYLFSLVRSRYSDGIELLETAHEALRRPARQQPLGDQERLARAQVAASWLGLLESAGLLEEAAAVAIEVQAALDEMAGTATRAYCRLALGESLRASGRNQEAIEHLEGALDYYQQVPDPFYAGLALWRLGWATYKNGQGERGIRLLRRGLALARQAGNHFLRAELLRSLGAMMWMLGGLTEEVEDFQVEAAALQREMGSWAAYAYNLSELANMPVWRSGDRSQAQAMLDEALTIAEEQNVPSLTAHVLAELTTLRLIDGRYDEALALNEQALALASNHLSTWTWASFQRGIAYLGLGRIDEARQAMKLPLSRMIEEDWSGLLRNLLSFAGIVLAEQGHESWAAELLALGLTHPQTPGRLAIDPLISRYRQKLENVLGPERFAAAWERGRELDALEAAAAILADWESPG
jgi:predicted ATPase/DNA-binding SARP family transcriptional activator